MEPPSTRTLTILRDPAGVRRGAQAISWHPDAASGRLAVAYSVLEFQRQPAGMPAVSHVWDVHSPGAPEASLAAPVPLVTLAFNLKDANLVGGGQYNGQVTFFDLRRGAAPVEATPVEHSHRDAVRAFVWTQVCMLAGWLGCAGAWAWRAGRVLCCLRFWTAHSPSPAFWTSLTRCAALPTPPTPLRSPRRAAS